MMAISADVAAALERSTPKRSTTSEASLMPAVSNRLTGTPATTRSVCSLTLDQLMHYCHQMGLWQRCSMTVLQHAAVRLLVCRGPAGEHVSTWH